MAGEITRYGSDIVEGKGKAFYYDFSRGNDYMSQAITAAKQKEADQAAAEKKKKEDQQALLDNYDINYSVLHQAYFTDRVKSLKEEGQALIATNHNLNDKSNEQVRDWATRMEKIKVDAKNSKALEEYGKQVLNMTPDQRSKYWGPSLKEAMDYYMPLKDSKMESFEQVWNRFQTEGLPKLQLKEELPDGFKGNQFPKSFNATFDTKLAGKSEEEIAKLNEQRVTKAKEVLDNSLRPEMFDAETKEEAIVKMEAYKDQQLALIKEQYPDLKANEQIRKSQDASRLGWARLQVAKDKEESKRSAIERAAIDLDGIIKGAVTGDPGALSSLANTIMNKKDAAGFPIIPAGYVVSYQREVWNNRKTVSGQTYTGEVYVPYQVNNSTGEKVRINPDVAPVLFSKNSKGEYTDTEHKWNYSKFNKPYSDYLGLKTTPGDASGQIVGAITSQSSASNKKTSGSGGSSKYVKGYREGGYEFQGGDPTDSKNWKKIQ